MKKKAKKCGTENEKREKNKNKNKEKKQKLKGFNKVGRSLGKVKKIKMK